MIGIIIIVGLVYFLVAILKKTHQELESNWSTLIDGLKYSTDDFYSILSNELNSNGIDNLNLNIVTLSEGGMFSSNRKYLRAKWKGLTFDICFAPFGNGSFVSYWLYSEPKGLKVLLSKLPFIGNYFAKNLFLKTFYQTDTEAMFICYCRNTILRVVDELAKSQDITSIPEYERQHLQQSLAAKR